jgi:hypothetical protein
MAVLERLIRNNLVDQISRMPRFVIEKFQKNLGRFKRDFFRDIIIKLAKIIGNLITLRIR